MGTEQVEVVREAAIGDRTVRVTATYRTGAGVAVDLVIEDTGGRCHGKLGGIVAASDLHTVSKALASLLAAVAVVLGPAVTGPPAPPADTDEARRRYPNAYRPWTAAEEARLIERYRTEPDLTALAREFGRRPGGIARRLSRLNLRTTVDRPDAPAEEMDADEPGWG